jgi:hypothetical protein
MSDLTVEGSARGIDRIIVVSQRGARSEGLELRGRLELRCGGCGEPFEPRRRDQRWCSAACRHRGYARARVEALHRHLTALENLRLWLLAELARREPVAAGRRHGRKAALRLDGGTRS